jgi:hypothetical protein
MKGCAVLLLICVLGVVIDGDGGVKQRPVYPGECLARDTTGRLFATEADGPSPCVAFDRRALPEPPPEPKPPLRCVPLSTDGFCGVIDVRCVSADNAPIF